MQVFRRNLSPSASRGRMLAWTLLGFGGFLALSPVIRGQDEDQAWRTGALGNPGQPLLVNKTEWEFTTDGPAYQATLSLTCRNPRPDVVEAVCYVPSPRGALERGFRVNNNGVRMEGQVRSRDRAIRVYREITRRRGQRGKDPAVLERLNEDWLRVTIFPVEAGARVSLEVSFVGLSESLGEVRRVDFPSPRTRGMHGRPLPMTVQGIIACNHQDWELYAPGQTITERMPAPQGRRFKTRSHVEARGVSSIFFADSQADQDVGLYCYRSPDDSGYVVAQVNASACLSEPLAQGDYVLVLDETSGLPAAYDHTARRLLARLIANLGEHDRFEIFTSDSGRGCFGGLVLADQDRREHAIEWLQRPSGHSRTDLADLMSHALPHLQASPRAKRLIMVSGVQELENRPGMAAALRSRFESLSRDLATFVVALGPDADREGLQSLARAGGGRLYRAATDEHLVGLVDHLAEAVRRPVLLAPQIDLAGAHESCGTLPPVLTFGQSVCLTARYDSGGASLVRIRGEVRGTELDEMLPVQFDEQIGDHPWVATWWASQRIDQLDRSFAIPESDSEYYRIRLCERFGILGPATVSLALEAAMMGRMPLLVGPRTMGLVLSSPLATAPGPPRGPAMNFVDRQERSMLTILEALRARTEQRTKAMQTVRDVATAGRASRPTARARGPGSTTRGGRAGRR